MIANCGVALFLAIGGCLVGAVSAVVLYAAGVYFIYNGIRWFFAGGRDSTGHGYATESFKMSVIFCAISWAIAALCFAIGSSVFKENEALAPVATAIAFVVIGVLRFRGNREEPWYATRVASILGVVYPIAYIAAGVLIVGSLAMKDAGAMFSIFAGVLTVAASAMWIVRSVFIIKEN